MTTQAHEKLNAVEHALLNIYRDRVQLMSLVDLRDPLLSKTYHELRELRDQMDACLGNIDEIRMILYKPPFGTEPEGDEEG